MALGNPSQLSNSACNSQEIQIYLILLLSRENIVVTIFFPFKPKIRLRSLNNSSQVIQAETLDLDVGSRICDRIIYKEKERMSPEL
jgi:hypothetical protein